MLKSSTQLDPLDRRLLALANGYTGLGTLASLLQVDDLTSSVQRLMAAGLLLSAGDQNDRTALWRPDQTRDWQVH